jgi:hypothetical protein
MRAPGTRKRSARHRLTLWVGGPEAVEGECWWYAFDRDRELHSACAVAHKQGADIPDDTYIDADPSMSQDTDDHGYGRNTTAILPWEEGE